MGCRSAAFATPRRSGYPTGNQEHVMGNDRPEPVIAELSSAECYQKLASHNVGRIGVNVDQYPLIIPVNYILDHNTVVLRTAPTTVVVDADHAKVTLQVDEFDVEQQSGWSVLLKGRGRAVHFDDIDELYARTTATRLVSWAPGARDLWIRITPDGVSGRRIVPGELEWRLDSAAYL
jgi:nitroimidazol reductase NimA-like FMN-containing flavoprotein (pyridoxamine 5'-phosphate oxidase superfamily)